MTKRFFFLIVSFLLVFSTQEQVLQASNLSIPLQGFVVDSNSHPLEGEQTLTFTLYDSCSESASAVGDPFVQNLNFSRGIYSTSILLDNTQQSTIQTSSETCIGIQVNTDPEMTPRLVYHSTPYAIHTLKADVASVAQTVSSDGVQNATGSGLRSSGGQFELDTSHSNNWSGQVIISRTPGGMSSDTASSSAALLVAPSSLVTGTNQIFFAVKDGDAGNELFTVDKEGDVSIRNSIRINNLPNCINLATNSQGYITCAEDEVSGGDISSVNAAIGISGGGLSGDISLAFDATELSDLTFGSGTLNSFTWNFSLSGSNDPSIEFSDELIKLGQNLLIKNQNELRLADADSSHYVGFKATENLSANYIWTLPSSYGSNGQFLSNDGLGNLSWSFLNSASIVNESITSEDILNGTIATVDLADNSITDDKVVNALTLSGSTINNSPIGASSASTAAFTTLSASSTTTLSSTVNIDGNLNINSNKFNVTASSGNTSIAGTLDVTNSANFLDTLDVSGNFAINTDKFFIAASTGDATIAGNLNLGEDFFVHTNKFTVAASTGNTNIAGTLSVTGNSNFANFSTAGQSIFTHNPTDTTSANATVRINPPTSDANEKFFVVQDNGSDVFSIDKEGDTSIAGNLNVTGTISAALTGNASTASALATNPSDCDPDTYATTIAANGNLTCTTVSSAGIANGVILNEDISASAAIDFSKLATLSAGNILLGNASNIPTSTSMTGDVAIDSSGLTTIQSNSVALGTDTTGNYIASITAGAGLSGTNNGEGTSPTFAVGAGAGITVNADDIEIDQSFSPTWTSLHTFSAQAYFTHNPTDTTSANATVRINPATSDANEKFFVVQDNGSDVFSIDKEGDTSIAGNLNVTGTISATLTGNASTASALATNPSDCDPDTYATTIAANGNLTCSTVSSAGIANGVILNEDISASAAIDFSKLATLSAGNILLGNASNIPTSTSMTGDVAIDSSGLTTIQSNSVALGTDTTGNYIASITAGAGLSGTNNGEGTSPTFAVGAGAGITVNADDIEIDQSFSPTWTSLHTFSAQAYFTHNPTDTTSANATVRINPATSDANEKFFVVQDNGSDVFSIDKEGDTSIAGNLNVTGTISATLTGNASTASALATNPSDCDPDTYATTIAANGNLTCSTVSSAGIANGVILNEDISASAAIDFSKLATLSAGNILLGNASNIPTSTSMTGDVAIDSSGLTTIQSNSVALGTDTTGNYIASITAGAGLSGTNNGEGTSPTFAVGAGAGITVNADDIEINTASNLSFTGSWDFGGGIFKIPNGSSLPGTCEIGDVFMDTDATSGQRLYLCQSSNTWALQGDGGGNFGDGSANAPSITFVSDTNTGIYRSGDDTLDFSTAGVRRMTLDSSGNLGIGDPSPTALLTVGNGDLFTVNSSGSVTAASLALGSGTITGAGLTDCDSENQKLGWDSSTSQFTCITNFPKTAYFTDSTSDTMADNSTTDLWDGTYPNITPLSSSSTVLVSVQIRVQGADADNEYLAFHVYRTIGGTTSSCAGTSVGPIFATYLTDTTGTVSASVTFLDTPATTSQVNYTVCSDSASSSAVDVDATTPDIHFTLTILGADLAENYYTQDETLQAGELVSLAPHLPAGVQRTQSTYDDQMIGIVSTAPGHVLDDKIGETFGRALPIALTGRVPIKVTTHHGKDPIEVGDYLTSSEIPGIAMKAKGPGQVIGKAMTANNQDQGMVLVFVEPGYRAGPLEKPSFNLQGQTLTNEKGESEILFPSSMGRSKPIIHLTIEGETLRFAQVGKWISKNGNPFSGFTIITFNPSGTRAGHTLVNYHLNE